MKTKRYGNYLNFDGMTWPLPVPDGESSVQWKLRNQPGLLTPKDAIFAASVMAAYAALVFKTTKERDKIVKNLRLDLEDENETRQNFFY